MGQRILRSDPSVEAKSEAEDDEYARNLRSNGDHFLRSLRSPGNSGHFLRSLKSAHYLFVICNLRVQLSSDLVLDFLLWFFDISAISEKKKKFIKIMGLITIKTSPMGNY